MPSTVRNSVGLPRTASRSLVGSARSESMSVARKRHSARPRVFWTSSEITVPAAVRAADGPLWYPFANVQGPTAARPSADAATRKHVATSALVESSLREKRPFCRIFAKKPTPGLEPGTPSLRGARVGSVGDWRGRLSRIRRKKKTGPPRPSPALLTKTHQGSPRVAVPAKRDTGATLFTAPCSPRRGALVRRRIP
jgi:hypothetical protein